MLKRYDRRTGACLTVDGDALRARRLALGLSQDDVARLVRLSQRMVASIELEERAPSFTAARSFLLALGDDCGITVEDNA